MRRSGTGRSAVPGGWCPTGIEARPARYGAWRTREDSRAVTESASGGLSLGLERGDHLYNFSSLRVMHVTREGEPSDGREKSGPDHPGSHLHSQGHHQRLGHRLVRRPDHRGHPPGEGPVVRIDRDRPAHGRPGAALPGEEPGLREAAHEGRHVRARPEGRRHRPLPAGRDRRGMSKTLLLGLDGATRTSLDPLFASGVMPFLREFTATGACGTLISTVCPVTPPAWTSMITGRSPGHHGIYDFIRVENQTLDHIPFRLANARDIRCEPLWSITGRMGKASAFLNVPNTFLAPAFNGVMVPGFVTSRVLRTSVHPRSYWKTIKDL